LTFCTKHQRAAKAFYAKSSAVTRVMGHIITFTPILFIFYVLLSICELGQTDRQTDRRAGCVRNAAGRPHNELIQLS